jgi:large subunit ribosomal protein L32
MAVPKKRKSAAKRDSRRAHHFLTAQSLINCPNCGEKMQPHRICPACGFYKGTEVVQVED